ncbi:hypothetical protein L083_6809 [Actinoplanes sp. N902-109]|nr:hypothetical protein L083_6809 [Actinoplanes sp. N902-109]
MCTRRLGNRAGPGTRTTGYRRPAGRGGPRRRGGSRRRRHGRAGHTRSRSRSRTPRRLGPCGHRVGTGATGRGGAGRGSAGGRRGRRRCGGSVRRLERTTQSPGHGGLNRAGCGFDELAHLLELGENGLAVDPELLRELVYAGLAWHCTPHFEVVRAAPAATSLVH